MCFYEYKKFMSTALFKSVKRDTHEDIKLMSTAFFKYQVSKKRHTGLDTKFMSMAFFKSVKRDTQEDTKFMSMASFKSVKTDTQEDTKFMSMASFKYQVSKERHTGRHKIYVYGLLQVSSQ